MQLNRRDFIKSTAVASAASAAGISLSGLAQNLVTDPEFTELKWSKAACRFCGTGCSVNVATKDGQVVATHADIESEVNRGLNCIKGYFLSKILYGKDRLTRRLLIVSMNFPGCPNTSWMRWQNSMHRPRGGDFHASSAGGYGGNESSAPGVRGGRVENSTWHHQRQARLPRCTAEPHAQGRRADILLGAGEQ